MTPNERTHENVSGVRRVIYGLAAAGSARASAEVMRNADDTTLRAALLRLGTPASVTTDQDLPLPLLLRAPAITLLWVGLLVTIVGLLALSRIRVPRVVRGVAVAVDAAPSAGADSVALVLLLPTSARPYIGPGIQAALEVGATSPVVVGVASLESTVIDRRTSRRRFSRMPSVLAQLETPKVALPLSRCRTSHECLTPRVGAVYSATATLGTRSLASYAWSSTPMSSR